MRGVRGHGIGAQIVNRIPLIGPPFWVLGGFLGTHHGGQDAVVVDVIPVGAGPFGQDELLEPLDASSADLTGYDGAKRFAVVGAKGFPIHGVGEHDAAVGVEDPVELKGGAVAAVGL